MATKPTKNNIQGVLKEVEGKLIADISVPECTEVSLQVMLDKAQGVMIAELSAPECTELRIQRPTKLKR
jgi:hypothetical protein